MDIASITKTVTAAEVITLVDSGAIELDASASRYLVHPLLSREPTVRQLLSHTSGVPDYFKEGAFSDAIKTDPGSTWTAERALGFITEPLVEPGSPVTSYSSSNYLLLGLLIEKVTGLSYAQALRRDVLAGMGSRMVVQDAEPPPPPLAAPDFAQSGIKPDDGKFLPNRALASATGAAGGIAADAPTLASWGYRLYGGQIVPADRTAEMTTAIARFPYTDTGYGLGTKIGTFPRQG